MKYDTDTAVIDKAYRKLMQKLHPDMIQAAGGDQVMGEGIMCVAYTIRETDAHACVHLCIRTSIHTYVRADL